MTFISNCDRAALIAPEDLANNIGKNLQRNGTLNEYVVKEQYSNLSISVFISGWVRPPVLIRMDYLKQSGIWDWMPKFIRNSQRYLLKEANLEVEKPDMSGNIVLLFLILLYGAIGATILFVFEVRMIFYRVALNIISKVSHLCKWIITRVAALILKIYYVCIKRRVGVN